MKNFLYFFLLMPFCAYTQSADQNYIMGITYKFPYEYTRDVLISGPDPQPFPLSDKIVNITYYDGLGRPSQQVGNGQSNNGKDIITHIEYDSFGRQAKEYMPYEGFNFSGNYNIDGLTETLDFYSNPSSPNSEATANPFSEKLFEPSPLNRVLKQGAPGIAWAMSPSANPDHTIKFEYGSVGSTDIVKFYRAIATWDSASGLYIPSLTSNGNYQAGQLYKTVAKDENWTSGLNNSTEEFKDKEGKTMLKRTYNAGVPHDTYYVYDQYGNLSYVLPPLSDGSGSSSDINEVCYQYRYDNRNRLAEKKLPGKQWEFIVYDNLDRVIATGPAFSPFSNLTDTGWLFTKYDVFGRITYTGWIPATVTGNERSSLQTASNMQTSNLSEAKSVSDNTVNGIAFRYTSTAWPTSGYHVLTVSYYDDYDYPNAPTTFDPIEGQTVYYNTTVKPKGLQTGTWKRIPNLSTSATSELSYTLYDSKDRVIRLKTINYLGGYTAIDNKLDFSGKVLYSVTRHSRAGAGELYVKDSYTYSDQDRLLTHVHQIGESGVPQLLAKNEYDELGRLIVKKNGGTDLSGSSSLQKVDYAYNIRGWLKEINKIGNLVQPGSPDDLFAFKINYESVENTIRGEIKPLYNGNISETFWRTSSNDIIRSYGYKYDNLNRLNKALYQKTGVALNSYDEEISYDKNGNITDLARNGGYDGDLMLLEMDRLEYTYHPQKKNQLMKVLDYTFNPEGFRDDSPDGIIDPVDDYSYDANGNMISDQNKGITSITYNHLNLPTKIVFGSESDKIEYLYDAAGKKVQKAVTQAGTATYFSYLEGFQYKSKLLLFFPTAEGYVSYTPLVMGGDLFNPIVITPESYNYVYNYTDHLGNIRLSYGIDPATNVLKIIEENHYYPFGLKHTNYSSDWNSFQRIDEKVGLRPGRPSAPLEYKYKYNGKELQDELGLNLYDYGARNYDPAIGRWMNIDPLAEKYRRWSPYNYCVDNPIYFIDPDGMGVYDWFKNQQGKVVWFDNKSTGFTDSNGGSWKNIGSNITEAKQSLNVPTENQVTNWKTVTFASDGTEAGGAKTATLKPIVFKNSAVVSYDLNVSNTSSTGGLVSGKSEITGVKVDAQVSSETSAPGIKVEGVSGFFGIKQWTPTGNDFTSKSSPFKDHSGPMLSNSPSHATSNASMSLSLSTYSKLTNSNPSSSGLNLNFQTWTDTSDRASIGPNELFKTSN